MKKLSPFFSSIFPFKKKLTVIAAEKRMYTQEVALWIAAGYLHERTELPKCDATWHNSESSGLSLYSKLLPKSELYSR